MTAGTVAVRTGAPAVPAAAPDVFPNRRWFREQSRGRCRRRSDGARLHGRLWTQVPGLGFADEAGQKGTGAPTQGAPGWAPCGTHQCHRRGERQGKEPKGTGTLSHRSTQLLELAAAAPRGMNKHRGVIAHQSHLEPLPLKITVKSEIIIMEIYQVREHKASSRPRGCPISHVLPQRPQG